MGCHTQLSTLLSHWLPSGKKCLKTEKAPRLTVSNTDSPNQMEKNTEGAFIQQAQTRYRIASKCLKFVLQLVATVLWIMTDVRYSCQLLWCRGVGCVGCVGCRGQRASPTFCGIIYFVLSLFTMLVLDSISQSSVHIKGQFQTTSVWVYSLLIFYLKEWNWRFFIAFVH